jgi:hypothetical protein
MATAAAAHAKPFIGIKIGAAVAVATVLLLAPTEEFDNLDVQNHIFQDPPCEHYTYGKE